MRIDPVVRAIQAVIPRLDPYGRVKADVNCVVCGYSLRTLSLYGRCPECGEAVKRCLPRSALYLADRWWLRQMGMGLACLNVALLLVPIGGLAVMMLASIATLFVDDDRITGVLFFLLTGLIAVLATRGAWLVTRPQTELAGIRKDWDVCRFARLLLVASVLPISTWAYLSEYMEFKKAGYVPDDPIQRATDFVGFVGLICGLACVLLLFVHLRMIGKRLADANLCTWARVVQFGLAGSLAMFPCASGIYHIRRELGYAVGLSAERVADVFAATGIVGGLLFGIWASWTLDRFQKIFDAAADARDASQIGDRAIQRGE